MGPMTAQRTTVRWADVDANGHARNTAYSEYGTDARLAHLATHGFTLARFHQLRLGPVVFTETLTYRRELHLGDQVTVTVELTALSSSGHRWGLQHQINRGEELAASVRLTGGWLSLDTRRLAAPPDALTAAMTALPRTDDFAEQPDSG